MVPLESQGSFYSCLAAAWSGSLFDLKKASTIGFPNRSYILDFGEFEFSYRASKLGFQTRVVRDAVVSHRIDGLDLDARYRLGPFEWRFWHAAQPPIRVYYYVRNSLNFSLYEYGGQDKWRGFFKQVKQASSQALKNLLLGPKKLKTVHATFLGALHGVTGQMDHRY